MTDEATNEEWIGMAYEAGRKLAHARGLNFAAPEVQDAIAEEVLSEARAADSTDAIVARCLTAQAARSTVN